MTHTRAIFSLGRRIFAKSDTKLIVTQSWKYKLARKMNSHKEHCVGGKNLGISRLYCYWERCPGLSPVISTAVLVSQDKNPSNNDVISENAIKNLKRKWGSQPWKIWDSLQKRFHPTQVSRRLQPRGGAQISLPSAIIPPPKRMTADLGMVKSKNAV